MVCYERAHQALAQLGDADGVLHVIHNKAVTLTIAQRLPRGAGRVRDARAHWLPRVGSIRPSRRPTTTSRGSITCAANTAARSRFFTRRPRGAKRTGDAYHAALSLLDLSEIYLELNLSVDAREMAEQAHTRFNELGMGYEAAKALANAATSHGQEGKAFKAPSRSSRPLARGWSASKTRSGRR